MIIDYAVRLRANLELPYIIIFNLVVPYILGDLFVGNSFKEEIKLESKTFNAYNGTRHTSPPPHSSTHNWKKKTFGLGLDP